MTTPQIGIVRKRETPKSSDACPIPTNSEMITPVFATNRQHYKRRPSYAELLANKVGQALTRNDAHPHAHFLYDNEADGHRDERP